jgi:KDO2-lipid IV(A) lauroyltransferase
MATNTNGPMLERERLESKKPAPERTARRLEAPHRRPAPASSGRLRRPVASAGRRLVERAAVIAYRVATWLLRHVPARLAVAILGPVFQASYLAWPAKRRWSNANFGHVLGTDPDDASVRQLALRAYRTYAHYIVELMRLPPQPDESYAARVDLVGIDDVLERWSASGRGLILTAGHVGSNEAVAAGIAHRGIPISVVADDSSFPELFDLLRRQRESWGLTIIPWRNLRDLFGVLRRREILALLVDWGYRDDGVPVRLFDAWTSLPAGPAVLAAKTNSAIVPITVRRTGTRFVVAADSLIEVPSSAPADIQRATQAIAGALERTVGAAPAQWYSFKPLWPETAAESDALARRAAEMLGSGG